MVEKLRIKGALSPEKKDGLFGFVNTKGEPIYPYKYDFCDFLFSTSSPYISFFLIREAGLYGIVSVEGETVSVIIPCKYLKIKRLTAILFVVQDENHLYGIYNDGKLTLPCDYNLIKEFDRTDKINYIQKVGLCRVKKGDKWGLVSRKGVEAFPCQYDNIEIKRDCYIVLKDRLKGIISFEGNIITPCQYDTIDNYFRYVHWVVSKNGLYGLLNSNGIEVFPCLYETIKKIGFTDLYMVSKGGLVGVLNNDGAKVIPCKYEKIIEPENGKCIVVMDGLFGLIDLKGNVIIPCQYEELHFFKGVDFLKRLYLVKKDGLFGILDEKNEFVIPCLYTIIKYWYGNNEYQIIGYKARRGDSYYYIDKKGVELKEISEEDFNETEYEEFEYSCDDWKLESRSYGRYAGSWAQDHEGYSDDDIDTIFDGEPDAYWNID